MNLLMRGVVAQAMTAFIVKKHQFQFLELHFKNSPSHQNFTPNAVWVLWKLCWQDEEGKQWAMMGGLYTPPFCLWESSGHPVDILDVYWTFPGFSLLNLLKLSSGRPVNVLYQPKFHWIVQDTYPVEDQ